MAGKRETHAGVSFRDVTLLWRELGREFGGDITSELVLPLRADSGVLFFVRVHFTPRLLGTRSTRSKHCVSAAWPNGQSSTIAGLLFRLSYEMGSELEKAKPVDPASEQTRFA